MADADMTLNDSKPEMELRDNVFLQQPEMEFDVWRNDA